MTEFHITNNTGSPIIFTTLDDFSLAAAATKDMFALANGNFTVSDMLDNEELQPLIDATDISIEDENATAITDLFILSSLLAGGNNKIGFITVTQAVDLDTIESDTATNNAKVTNATHTGEVTGSGALTVDPTAISNKASVTAASGMEILVNDSGTLKKADASDFLSAGSGLDALETVTLDGGNIITPPEMTNDVHDYNPTGFSTCNMMRQSISSNGKKITGFPAPAAGVHRIIAVNNISSSGRDLKFEHQDSNSSSANRLYLRDNGARTIRPNETAMFWYDHISSGWRSYNRIG